MIMGEKLVLYTKTLQTLQTLSCQMQFHQKISYAGIERSKKEMLTMQRDLKAEGLPVFD